MALLWALQHKLLQQLTLMYDCVHQPLNSGIWARVPAPMLGRALKPGAALLRRYDPEFVPNQSDDTGRYRYEEQPAACYWNCEKLAEALKAVLSRGRALSWLQSNFYLEFQRCAETSGLCHGLLGACRQQEM